MAQLANVAALLASGNLKGYWKFENGLTDVQGNTNLTGSGSPTYINGPFGKGLKLVAASSQYVYAADNATMSITGDISLSIWVFLAQLPSTATTAMDIMSKYYSGTANNRAYALYLTDTDKLEFIYTNDGTNTNREKFTSDAAFFVAADVGKWVHICLTADVDGHVIKMYKDGLSKANTRTTSGTGASAIINSDAEFRIGGNVSGGYLDGRVDDAAVFDTVLTIQQVLALAQRGIAATLLDTLPSTNLKLLLKLDETSGTTATDSSGNSHDGTASNASILNNDYGMVDYRGAFIAASSNKITITDHADLKPTGSFSIGLWFRSSTTGATQYLFQSFSHAASKLAGVYVQITSADVIQFLSGKNTGQTNNVDYGKVDGSTTVTDGKWHHLVATWDGSNLRLYLDGKAEGSATSWANAPVYETTNYVRVACHNATGTDDAFLDGDLDEVFMYNGAALTLAQITLLYNSKQGNAVASVSDVGSHANLKLLLKFDETSGTNAADSSGLSHDGTASNADILNNAYAKFSNKAVFVSANSREISITSHADLKPTGNFSIGLWVRTVSSGATQGVFQSFSVNPSNAAGLLMYLLSSDGKIYFESAKNTGNTVDTDYKLVATAAAINDGKWHHIVVTWNGSTLILYLDGKSSGTASWANAPAYGTNNYVHVGCASFSGTPTWFFDGDIDDLFLINGTALADDVILELYRLKISSNYTQSFDETITVTDTLVKSPARTFAETITLSEVFEALKGRSITFVDDVMTMTDSMTRALTKTFAETITLSEVFARAIGRVFTETATEITDTIDFVQGRGIEFFETINITDSLSRAFTRVVSETITVTDTLVTNFVYFLNVAETITMTEVFQTIFGKTFSDTITMSDTMQKFLNGISNLWTKVRRTVGSWTGVARTPGDWTKTERN